MAQRANGFDRLMEAQASGGFLADGVIRRLQQRQQGAESGSVLQQAESPDGIQSHPTALWINGNVAERRQGVEQQRHRLRVSAAHLSQPPGCVVLSRNVLGLVEVGDHLCFAQGFHHPHSSGKSSAQLEVRWNRNAPATEPQHCSLDTGS